MGRLLLASPRTNQGRKGLTAEAKGSGFVWRLRKSAKYQRPLQTLKWRLSPGVAATAIYFIGITMAAAVLLSLAHRIHLAWAERAGTSASAAGRPQNVEFSTSNMCWNVQRLRYAPTSGTG